MTPPVIRKQVVGLLRCLADEIDRGDTEIVEFSHRAGFDKQPDPTGGYMRNVPNGGSTITLETKDHPERKPRESYPETE